jgi:outer membrane protein assembly factor BamB
MDPSISWRRYLLAICLTLGVATNLARAERPWAQFRGPVGSGISRDPNVTVAADPIANVRWRTPTPGLGWSSPVTDGRLIWMTAAITSEASPDEQAQALAGDPLASAKNVAGTVQLLAMAVDAATGSIVHQIDLDVVAEPKPIHAMNSYASPTPAIHDDRIVVHFGRYGTWCLDAVSGETLWNRRIVIEDSVGPGSSPVVHDGLVLLTCDGTDKQFIEALSLANGETVWKTDRPPIGAANGEQRKSFSTPLVIEVNGGTQAIIPGAQWCVAYDVSDGREIWRVEHGGGFSITPMPSLIGERIVFSTGFMKPELLAVDPTGKGDVTNTHVAWRTMKGGSRRPSMVSDDLRLYCVSDDGILTVLRHSTGNVIYRERLGGQYSSSPLRVGDRILIADHEGLVRVFLAGDDYREVASYDLGEQIMASPAVLGEDLLIRTAAALYRFSGN